MLAAHSHDACIIGNTMEAIIVRSSGPALFSVPETLFIRYPAPLQAIQVFKEQTSAPEVLKTRCTMIPPRVQRA